MTIAELSGAVVFETERLLVRRWLVSDLEPLLAVYGDSDAMKWVGDGAPLSRVEGAKWLEVTSNNYRTRGYGMFAVVLRESRSVIGFCGLVHPGGQPEAEIKYAFARTHWGAGYATEVVSGLLAYGKTEHGLLRIIATVAPENAASRRVLAKVGMTVDAWRENGSGSRTAVYSWVPERA